MKAVHNFHEKPEDPKRNQSFMYLIKNNLLDIYFKPENLAFIDEKLEISMPIRLTEYQVKLI